MKIKLPKKRFFKSQKKSDQGKISPPDLRHRSLAYRELIRISIAQMRAKKARTIVTVGGMSIGVAAIVFLISIGYGLQELVISRVARLDELKQANVVTQQGSNVKITDQTLTEFAELPYVLESLPMISLVGRINFQNSQADVAAFGVTSKYLESSALRPTKGEIFDNNQLIIDNNQVSNIEISTKKTKEDNSDNSDSKTQDIDSDTNINAAKQINVKITDESSTGSLQLVEMTDEGATEQNDDIEQVVMAANTPRQTVVNRSFLQILNLPEENAINTTFEVSFVIVSNLLDDASRKVESYPVNYTIVGILPEEKEPAMYVPFIDLRSLGITNYSQVKVIAEHKDNLQQARAGIESLGFATTSVVDTVDQINGLFATLRLILGIVGLVALSIAALGMFNTLTVSLLERTHEIGLMKAVGMKSYEVRRLFLVESLTMGIVGGLVGFLLGWLAGIALSLALSYVAVSKGFESIMVSSVPLSLIAGTFILSLVVGLTTGFYPAWRATKISPLDAMRYE